MQESEKLDNLSPTSIQKLKKKEQKKKFQNSNINQNFDRKFKIKNTNHDVENEATEKNFSNCIDLKDFPELKVSEKQNRKLYFENSNVGFTGNQQWLTVVSNRHKKKSNAVVPSLPGTEHLEKEKISTNIKKDITEATLEKSFSDLIKTSNGKKKESSTNIKENKATSQKNTVQPQRNPNKKKRSDPLFINLQDILAAKKVPRKGKKQHILGSKVQRHNDKELLSGNFLDSANPKRSRGKHREIKKKKLTNFKMTIIKERIIKSKLRENNVASQFGTQSDSQLTLSTHYLNLFDTIDFNSEIKIYLSQLKDKQLKNLNNKKNNKEEKENEKKSNVEEKNTEEKVLIKKNENLVCVEKQIPQISPEGEIKFSSKFKEYCDNIITPDLNSAVMTLISEIIKLQDRLFLRDPTKAKAKKRHVSGIREVKKYLNLKKVKLVLIAPNLEKLQMEGSTFDAVNELKSMADSQNVPYGFSLDRYKLGRCTKKKVPVSAFAVLNYEGLEALFKNVMEQLTECKKKFNELKKPNIQENTDDVNTKLLSNLVTAFQETLKVDNSSRHKD